MIDAFELEGLESVSMHDDGEYWNDVDVELEGGTHFGSPSISQPLRNVGSSWDLGFSLPQGNIFDYNYSSENLQMARTGLYDAISNSTAVQDMIAVENFVLDFAPGSGIKQGIQDLRDGDIGMGLFNIATDIPGGNIFKFGKFAPSGITRNSLGFADNAIKNVTNAGEILGDFGIPKYYTYTNGLKSVFVTPHAMKHLEELATHGAGNPGYLRLLGQTHQKASNLAHDILEKNKDAYILEVKHSHPGEYNPITHYPATPSGFDPKTLKPNNRRGDRKNYERGDKYEGRRPSHYKVYVPGAPNIQVKYNGKEVIRTKN